MQNSLPLGTQVPPLLMLQNQEKELYLGLIFPQIERIIFHSPFLEEQLAHEAPPLFISLHVMVETEPDMESNPSSATDPPAVCCGTSCLTSLCLLAYL